VILVRGKISAKDREGNIGEEVKILVDDAREITGEQALSYQPTGKKMRPPGSKKSPAAAVTATKPRPPAKSGAGTDEKKPSGVAAALPTRIYIRLHDSQDHEQLKSIKQAIDASTGPTEVVLVLGPSDNKQIIKLPSGVSRDEAVVAKLQSIAGVDNVKLQ
jgi:hypothetical protein